MKLMAYVTRRIPEPALELLAKHFELKINPWDRALEHKELIDAIRDVDAFICLLTDAIDREVINAAAKLKVISNYAVGYNNIDVDFATLRGIAVCNTPGVLTETTADLTWALIMSTCRRITESEAFLRAGRFKAWEPMLMLGQDVFGKTLGVIGMGRIGKAVAKRAQGFDLDVLCYDPSVPESDLPQYVTAVDLDTLLQKSDIITLHVPLLPETKHLIGKTELQKMKPTAVLINTSRGAIVDETELIKALQNQQIFGAGFDVYEQEPHIPAELLALENVVLLPHIGSASISTRTKMGLLAAENAIAVIEGRTPPSRVN